MLVINAFKGLGFRVSATVRSLFQKVQVPRQYMIGVERGFGLEFILYIPKGPRTQIKRF